MLADYVPRCKQNSDVTGFIAGTRDFCPAYITGEGLNSLCSE
jgi:hypothetical protein